MNTNNIAIFTGRLATNITVRGKDDKPAVSTLIITQDGYYNSQSEWVEQTSAIPVILFGGAAKRALKHKMAKGEEWSFCGTMQSGSYEKGGQTIHTLELQVSSPGMVQLRSKPSAK